MEFKKILPTIIILLILALLFSGCVTELKNDTKTDKKETPTENGGEKGGCPPGTQCLEDPYKDIKEPKIFMNTNFSVADPVDVQLFNGLRESIFSGSSSDYILEKKDGDTWKQVNEGENSEEVWEVKSRQVYDILFDTLALEPGTYRIKINYGKKCNIAKSTPVKMSSCQEQETLLSDELIVSPEKGLEFYQECEQPNDCVLVENDCGCGGAGNRVAINKNSSGIFQKITRKKMEGFNCLTVMSNDPSCKPEAKAICSPQGKCEVSLPELVPAKEIDNCGTNDDCVLVQAGACSCSYGGLNKAINKEFKEKYLEDLKKKSEEIVCPAVVSNDSSCKVTAQAICIAGKCDVAT